MNFPIPQYNVFKDKYCDGYSQYIMKKHKKGVNNVQFAPGRIRKKPSDILTNDSNNLQPQPPIRYRPDSVDNRGSTLKKNLLIFYLINKILKANPPQPKIRL